MDDSSLPMSTASPGGQTRCGSHCVSQSECRLQTADLGATVGTCPNLPVESGKDRRARRVCAVALQAAPDARDGQTGQESVRCGSTSSSRCKRWTDGPGECALWLYKQLQMQEILKIYVIVVNNISSLE